MSGTKCTPPWCSSVNCFLVPFEHDQFLENAISYRGDQPAPFSELLLERARYFRVAAVIMIPLYGDARRIPERPVTENDLHVVRMDCLKAGPCMRCHRFDTFNCNDLTDEY